jgi:hypothetical protein
MTSKDQFSRFFCSLFLSVCPVLATDNPWDGLTPSGLGKGAYAYDHSCLSFSEMMPQGERDTSQGQYFPMVGNEGVGLSNGYPIESGREAWDGSLLLEWGEIDDGLLTAFFPEEGGSSVLGSYSYDEIESSPSDWSSNSVPCTPREDLSKMLPLSPTARPSVQNTTPAPIAYVERKATKDLGYAIERGVYENDQCVPSASQAPVWMSPVPSYTVQPIGPAESAPPSINAYDFTQGTNQITVGQEGIRPRYAEPFFEERRHFFNETSDSLATTFSQTRPAASSSLKRPRPVQGRRGEGAITIIDLSESFKKQKVDPLASRRKAIITYDALLQRIDAHMKKVKESQEAPHKILFWYDALEDIRAALKMKKKAHRPFLYESLFQGFSSLSVIAKAPHEQNHFYQEACEWYETAQKELRTMLPSIDRNMAFLHVKSADTSKSARTKTSFYRKALFCYQKAEEKIQLSSAEYAVMMRVCLALQFDGTRQEESYVHQKWSTTYYEKIKKTQELSATIHKGIFDNYEALIARESDSSSYSTPAAFACLRYLKATPNADPKLYAKAHHYFMDALERMQHHENKVILLKNALYCFVEGLNKHVHFDLRLCGQMASSSLFLAEQGVEGMEKGQYYRSAAILYEHMVNIMQAQPHSGFFGEIFFNMAYANLQAGRTLFEPKEKTRHLEHAANHFKNIIETSFREEKLAHVYAAITHMHLSDLILEAQKAHLILATSYFERGDVGEVTFPTLSFEYAASCYYRLSFLEEHTENKQKYLRLADGYMTKDQNNGQHKTLDGYLLRSKIAFERSELTTLMNERAQYQDVARANAEAAYNFARNAEQEALSLLKRLPLRQQ